MSVRQRLAQALLGSSATEKLPGAGGGGSGGGGEKGASPASTPATTRARAQSERFRDVAQKLTDRTDTAAKSIASLGTAAVSALGIARIADLFPNPYGDSFWCLLIEPAPLAMFIGFGVMIATVLILAQGFWTLQKPLVVTADLDATVRDEGLDDKERAELQKVYGPMAANNNMPSLRKYERKGWRKETKARELEVTDPNKAQRLRAEGDEIAAEVEATLARARLNILRLRSNRALRGRRATASLVALLLGVLVFSIGADAVESDRTGELDLAKQCADVRALAKVNEAKVDDTVCGSPPGSAAQAEASAQDIANAAVIALSTAFGECRAAADKAGGGGARCELLAQALVAATELGAD